MLTNIQDYHNPRVEFVSYDGRYPCLCSGNLVLKIEGETVKFDKYKDRFWYPGGGINDGGVYIGEWTIDVSEIPEPYRKYAAEIDLVFNENVPYGCCGGCT